MPLLATLPPLVLNVIFRIKPELVRVEALPTDLFAVTVAAIWAVATVGAFTLAAYIASHRSGGAGSTPAASTKPLCVYAS